MKKLFNLTLVLFALILASCDYNDKNFPGYDELANPSDIQAMEYILTDADYKTIANNSSNKSMAKEAGVDAQLKLVESQKAFNPDILARDYMPAFLAYRFPTLDDKSAIRVTYNFIEDLGMSYPELNGMSIVSLNTNDYDTVYGTTSNDNFFKNEADVNKGMSKILKGRVKEVAEGQLVLATYNLTADKVVTSSVWKYTSEAWSAYDNKEVYVMQKVDYATMSIGYDNFSGSQADSYLPTFLKIKFPYTSADTKKTVVYKFYASSNTTVRADEYVYDGSNWTKQKSSVVVTMTDQFVRTGNVWMYNPSVTINLSPIRNDKAIQDYYQAAVDWVWENIDQPAGCTQQGQGYVTSYKNDDKFGGMSAYYNNIDQRAAKAVEQVKKSPLESISTAYDNMTDEEIMAKMRENLKLELAGMLEKKHPEATPVDGIDVIYTINMPIYTGTNVTENNWTIQYKVVSQGKFEYVENSLKPIEK